jgi:hypothetical protein
MMMIKVRYNKRELMFQLPLHIMLSETNKITRELIEREREKEREIAFFVSGARRKRESAADSRHVSPFLHQKPLFSLLLPK